jgi:hypothetical protein
MMTFQLTSTTRTFRFLVSGTCEWTTPTQEIVLPTNSNITIQSSPDNLDAVLFMTGPFTLSGSNCSFLMYGMRIKMSNVTWKMSDGASLSFVNCTVENNGSGP